MNKLNTVFPTDYPPLEEKLNVISHALGCFLSMIALVFLILRANQYGNIWHLTSFSIYGMSLILLYAASTFYHNEKNQKLRFRLQIVDHCAIYLLIAGTYTPFALITLSGTVGWTIFAIVWSMAATGIVLKFFFTGKYNLLSTIMYVFMGWMIVFAIQPLINSFPYDGILWLIAGGVSYTVGAVFFSIDRLHFNHAIFHVFVLIGSFCHFMAVYFYVLPIS